MKQVCMIVTNRGIDDPRVRMEGEALARGGYGVTVVGWDRDAESDAQVDQAGVRYLRLRLRSTHGRGLGQAAFLAGFYTRAWNTIRRMSPHAIHCHDLDTLPLGLAAARAGNARLVFDAHESFPDMMVGHLPDPAVRCLRRLERGLVRRCDLVVTVGRRLAGHYADMQARDVLVVGNWKDPAEFDFPAEQIRRTRKQLGIAGKALAVCFVANLGRERRVEPLLEAAAGDSRFACVIGGDGPQAELVESYARRHDNITYLGRVPPEHVPAITAACDVVYYGFDTTNPNAQWSAPNKLYEAIAAGKPMISGDFGEIGQTLRDEGCGVIADFESTLSVRKALEELSNPVTRRRMALNARKARRLYCRDRVEPLLSEAYARLLGVALSAPAEPAPAAPGGPRDRRPRRGRSPFAVGGTGRKHRMHKHLTRLRAE